MNHSAPNPFVDDRRFYFNKLYYLGQYSLREKTVFQKAKFQNDTVMQSYLLSYLTNTAKTLEFQNMACIIPAPSSKKIMRFFSRQLAKQFQIPVLNIFKKTTKQQNKKLDQFSRYREIQYNIILNSDIKLSINNHEKILIFDDLWTTGATMNHICKLLVDQGIQPAQIDCMVFFIRPKILSFRN